MEPPRIHEVEFPVSSSGDMVFSCYLNPGINEFIMFNEDGYFAVWVTQYASDPKGIQLVRVIVPYAGTVPVDVPEDMPHGPCLVYVEADDNDTWSIGLKRPRASGLGPTATPPPEAPIYRPTPTTPAAVAMPATMAPIPTAVRDPRKIVTEYAGSEGDSGLLTCELSPGMARFLYDHNGAGWFTLSLRAGNKEYQLIRRKGIDSLVVNVNVGAPPDGPSPGPCIIRVLADGDWFVSISQTYSQ